MTVEPISCTLAEYEHPCLRSAGTLRDLDPESATRFERLVRDAIAMVNPLRKPPTAGLDANGWPVGYFERTFGCARGEEWELPNDPPPEPTLEP